MFKIRTITSLVVLALTFMTTYQFVDAKAAVNPVRSYHPASVISNQGVSTSSLNTPLIPDPLPQPECVDMPFGAVASVYACPNPSQIPAPAGWNQAGKALKTLNAYAPPNPSTLVKCTNLPFGAVASIHACPDPSQIPIPEWLIMGGETPHQ